jgi:hypothetical protein
MDYLIFFTPKMEEIRCYVNTGRYIFAVTWNNEEEE